MCPFLLYIVSESHLLLCHSAHYDTYVRLKVDVCINIFASRYRWKGPINQ